MEKVAGLNHDHPSGVAIEMAIGQPEELRRVRLVGHAASIGLTATRSNPFRKAAMSGAVAIAATALSLTDLADSIGEVAHVALWKSYALALALDLNFIATESFSLFASATVARATGRATTATKAITLIMSAVANSWAMAHGADGYIMQAACVVARCSVPALIALATYTLGKAVRA
jgi:hypothetical protein